MYAVRGGELFCVEIRNTTLSRMQKQLFKYVWSRASPMQKLDDFGNAAVKSK